MRAISHSLVLGLASARAYRVSMLVLLAVAVVDDEDGDVSDCITRDAAGKCVGGDISPNSKRAYVFDFYQGVHSDADYKNTILHPER